MIYIPLHTINYLQLHLHVHIDVQLTYTLVAKLNVYMLCSFTAYCISLIDIMYDDGELLVIRGGTQMPMASSPQIENLKVSGKQKFTSPNFYYKLLVNGETACMKRIHYC